MEGKDNIKELFSQKLGNYEAKVNPELWAKISTQVAVGTTTTVASGVSVFAKVAIGLGVSAAVISTVVILTQTPDEIISEQSSIEIIKEEVNSKTIEIEKATEVKNQNSTESRNSFDNNLVPIINSETPPNLVADARQPSSGIVAIIPTRGASLVKNEESSVPTIIEGVTYGGMTNYGTAPANQTVIVEETPEKEILVEPIKRYINTFTPNGDGRNDYFELASDGLTDFSVVVFSPTGEIVYQSNDPDFKWDGRDLRTGNMVETGTYMYMVSAYDSEGKPYPIYERLTINR